MIATIKPVNISIISRSYHFLSFPHYEMIATIKPANISIISRSYHFLSFPPPCFFPPVVRHLSTFLANFKHVVLLTAIPMLYLRSPELIHLA